MAYIQTSVALRKRDYDLLYRASQISRIPMSKLIRDIVSSWINSRKIEDPPELIEKLYRKPLMIFEKGRFYESKGGKA